MALCKSYNDLSHFDKIQYVGELLHACQSDEYLFKLGADIIKTAKDIGLFNGVVILPEIPEHKENNLN
jgi:hypothetical protein